MNELWTVDAARLHIQQYILEVPLFKSHSQLVTNASGRQPTWPINTKHQYLKSQKLDEESSFLTTKNLHFQSYDDFYWSINFVFGLLVFVPSVLLFFLFLLIFWDMLIQQFL